MPLGQSLALLCATHADGEAIPPNLALLAYGALKYCHTSGVGGVLLVTELHELLESITVCFICFCALCFCALFFAKLLEFLLVNAVHRGEQGLSCTETLVLPSLLLSHCSISLLS